MRYGLGAVQGANPPGESDEVVDHGRALLRDSIY